MFTGIIETLAKVENIKEDQGNIHFTLSAPFTNELKIDQSVAHDGVCLTVVEIENQNYTVTAIAETLNKTNLRNWKKGSIVNVERCMKLGERLDGHIVQGHVDTTAVCKSVTTVDGSWEFEFNYETDDVTVPKGSITINGVSLTVVKSTDKSFSVCIIPYTYEHTNFHTFKEGTVVNLEFDVIGKYVARLLAKQKHT